MENDLAVMGQAAPPSTLKNFCDSYHVRIRDEIRENPAALKELNNSLEGNMSMAKSEDQLPGFFALLKSKGVEPLTLIGAGSNSLVFTLKGKDGRAIPRAVLRLEATDYGAHLQHLLALQPVWKIENGEENFLGEKWQAMILPECQSLQAPVKISTYPEESALPTSLHSKHVHVLRSLGRMEKDGVLERVRDFSLTCPKQFAYLLNEDHEILRDKQGNPVTLLQDVNAACENTPTGLGPALRLVDMAKQHHVGYGALTVDQIMAEGAQTIDDDVLKSIGRVYHCLNGRLQKNGITPNVPLPQMQVHSIHAGHSQNNGQIIM